MSYSKRGKPTYKLLRVESVSPSGFAVVYEQDVLYRKIVRYHTEGRIRYPLYGDWLLEKREIRKKCSSSFKALEALERHKDPLLASFAYDIIALAYSEDPTHWPSWFQNERLRRIHKKRCLEILSSHQANQTSFSFSLKEEEFQLIKLRNELEEAESKWAEDQGEEREGLLKLEKAEAMKKNVFLDMMTFGIRGYWHSFLRKRILMRKIRTIQAKVVKDDEKINGVRKNAESHQKLRDSFEKRIQEDNGVYSEKSALNDAWLEESLRGVMVLGAKKKKGNGIEDGSVSHSPDITDVRID